MFFSLSENIEIKNTFHNNALLFLCALSMSTNLSAAFEHYPLNPSAVGSGLITVNLHANAIGIFADPSSVSSFHTRHFGISSGKRFGLNMLKHHSAALAQPIRNGFFALGASIFGDKLYSETIWCLVMGKQFNDKINVGLGLMYYDLRIENYGQAGSLGINAGWRIELDKSLKWIGSWRNVNGPTIGTTQDL
ncbi:MAG: hypothetical protein U9M99_03930, partial [Thermoproteota archaeon]|nr:hypothetical protein [Thermoproteota archaeon]